MPSWHFCSCGSWWIYCCLYFQWLSCPLNHKLYWISPVVQYRQQWNSQRIVSSREALCEWSSFKLTKTYSSCCWFSNFCAFCSIIAPVSLEEKLQLVLKIGPLQHWAHECLTNKSFNCSTLKKMEISLWLARDCACITCSYMLTTADHGNLWLHTTVCCTCMLRPCVLPAVWQPCPVLPWPSPPAR